MSTHLGNSNLKSNLERSSTRMKFSKTQVGSPWQNLMQKTTNAELKAVICQEFADGSVPHGFLF